MNPRNLLLVAALGWGCTPTTSSSNSAVPTTPTNSGGAVGSLNTAAAAAAPPPPPVIQEPKAMVSSPSSPNAPVTVAPTVSAAQASNQLAFDVYSKVREGEGNRLFSPVSAEIALVMASAGAVGDTQLQMEKVLHTGNSKQMHSAFAELLVALNNLDGKDGLALRVADRIWGQQGFKFKTEFVNLLQTHYKAPLGEVDFIHATETARSTINRWVAGETRDRIQGLLPPGVLTARSRLVLTNAVYFKGQWEKRFDVKKTQDAEFHSPKGKFFAKLMSQLGEFRYAQVEGAQVLELPYRGGLTMVVVLPDAADGLPAIEARAAVEQGAWLQALTPTRVNVRLPRWKTTLRLQLGDTLKALGMPLAFSEQANFSAMAEGEKLQIGEVIHQAFIEVNEEGSEAAAATAVTVHAFSARPSFNADHPFLYWIRDPSTGTLLFLGRVVDPR